MRALRFLFSPSGRLAPPSFAYAVVAVYFVGAVCHLLTRQEVVVHAGLWPFMAVQVVLIWIWFALHVRRLHDAGRSAGIAAGVAIVYALSIVLLLFVMLGFFDTARWPMSNPAAGAALSLLLVLRVIGSLMGSLQLDLAWLFIATLIFLAFVPLVVAVAISTWAATRPSVAGER